MNIAYTDETIINLQNRNDKLYLADLFDKDSFNLATDFFKNKH